MPIGPDVAGSRTRTSSSPGARLCSRFGSVFGPTNSSAIGIVRVDSPETSTRASSASRAQASVDGWTMKLGPPPRIAWYLFSPVIARQALPPFFRQFRSALRKYQQRGRCSRLPPRVARLRMPGVAAEPAA
jgi:hypothetical protein